MVTKLTASGATTLTLSTEEGGQWCSLILLVGGRVHELGADDLTVIKQRLARAVSDVLAGDKGGKIDGLEVTWIASLSERHASIYAADENGHRLIFFADERGQLLARVELQDDERRRWLGTLTAPT
jgi:hypothetical protein